MNVDIIDDKLLVEPESPTEVYAIDCFLKDNGNMKLDDIIEIVYTAISDGELL